MVWEGLHELASSLRQTCKENATQTADIESRGSFKLQLTNVVLDDSRSVLQEQVACLENNTEKLQK